MLRRLWRWFGAADGDRGVASLEFALVAPILITMTLGTWDLLNGVIVWGQVDAASHAIASSASSLAVQSDNSTTLTVTNVQQTLSAIFAEVPVIRRNAAAGTKSATMTSVNFTLANPSCTSACAYVANVAWSVAYVDPPTRYTGGLNTFQQVTRACGQLTQVSATSYTQGDLTSLPTQGVSTPLPILVVDVHYQYLPTFLHLFLKTPLDFWSTAIWPARSVNINAPVNSQYTTYDLTNQNAGVGKCPGYD